MSFTLNRQPTSKRPAGDQLVVWVYGLADNDRPGDFVKKPMRECTGRGDHHGVALLHGRAGGGYPRHGKESAHCIPCMMPYITAFFMPRRWATAQSGARGLRQLRLHRPV